MYTHVPLLDPPLISTKLQVAITMAEQSGKFLLCSHCIIIFCLYVVDIFGKDLKSMLVELVNQFYCGLVLDFAYDLRLQLFK